MMSSRASANAEAKKQADFVIDRAVTEIWKCSNKVVLHTFALVNSTRSDIR